MDIEWTMEDLTSIEPTPEHRERCRIRTVDLPGLDILGLQAFVDGEYVPLIVDRTEDSIVLYDDGPKLRTVPKQHVYVSTEHASTRDRIARWMAARLGMLTLFATAPTWRRSAGMWLLRATVEEKRFLRPSEDTKRLLSGLDFGNLDDAIGLAEVAREVAERTPADELSDKGMRHLDNLFAFGRLGDGRFAMTHWK